MIRWLLHKGTRAFEARYDYDASYQHRLIDISKGAGLRMAVLPLFSQYRGPKVGRQVWLGAIFASTLEGDCGPCSQLILDMAAEAGADMAPFRMCAAGQAKDAGDVGLGFRFAMAAISGDAEADSLRAEIETAFGAETLAAATFGAAFGRVYPVLKRGLGYGKTCQSLKFGDSDVLDFKRAASG